MGKTSGNFSELFPLFGSGKKEEALPVLQAVVNISGSAFTRLCKGHDAIAAQCRRITLRSGSEHCALASVGESVQLPIEQSLVLVFASNPLLMIAEVNCGETEQGEWVTIFLTRGRQKRTGLDQIELGKNAMSPRSRSPKWISVIKAAVINTPSTKL